MECLFRFPYGLSRAWRDLELSGSVLGGALARVFGTAAFLLCVAVVLRKATQDWSPLAQLVVNGLVYAAVALPTIYYVSLPHEPRQRIYSAILRRLGRA
jgi:hypothetical protein